MSRGHISPALFDGIADTPAQAADMAFRVNQKRDEAKAVKMAAMGPAGFLAGAK